MAIYSTDHYVLPLPEWHRFPMAKYRRLRERIVEAGLVSKTDLCVPPAATNEEILRVHQPDYLDRVLSGRLLEVEARALGFPWSEALVERSRRSSGATISAARDAVRGERIGINLAGGTHHAAPDRCAGYCVFNDAGLAARAMQAEGLVDRVIVIDCDVHQGDGTALIFADDPSVFTYSIHGAKNYPLQKPPSDLDVPLPDKTDDNGYLQALGPSLNIALDRAEADLAIYIAGADPFHEDQFGRMALSKEGLAARDRLVFNALRAAGLPAVVCMAGGYAKDLEAIVDIHFRTVQLALELYGSDTVSRLHEE